MTVADLLHKVFLRDLMANDGTAKPTPTHPPQTAHMTRETQTYTTVYGPPLGGPPQDIASVLAQRGGRCAVLRRDGRVSFMEAPYTETNYSGMSEEDGHVSGDLLPADEPLSSDLPPPGYLNLPIDKQQADIMCYPRRLLDYYMGTYGTTTPLKAPQPPPGFDVNKILTRKGHTLLHLAASMGDIVSVKHLLELGADPHAGLIEEVVDADTPNGVIKRRTGATPLMYAAQFTNNYERRTMEALFQTMAITLVQKDEYGNTILHYAANLTENLGFQRCAAYYLEAIAYWLKMTCDSAPFTEHVDLRNRKGDTALIIVAKNRARLAINSLLGCGASEHIPDRDGKSADIYLWEAIRATENDQAARSSMSEEGPPASESSVVEAIRDNVEPDVAVTFAKDVEKWQHEEAEKDAEIQGLQSTREQLQEAADETRLMLANVSQEVDLGRATEPAEVQELTELQRDYEAHNRALSDYWVAFTNKRKESQLAPSQRVPQVPSTDEDLQERLDGVDSLRRQRDVHGAQVAQMLPAEHVAAVGEDGETAHYKELFKLGAGLGAEDNVDQLGPIFLEELQAEKEMREGCERLRKQASGAHGDPAGGAHGGNTD